MSNTNQIKSIDAADILKFIMSVLVVATHTGLFAPHLTPIVRLAVPVFFVLSGYFFFSKINASDTLEKKRQYLVKSIRHNLRLYIFWFIVLSPITFYIRDYFSDGVLKGFLSLAQNFLFGSTFQASWYITALIWGLVILFFLSQKLSNTLLVVLGIILYISALLSSNYAFIPMMNETAMAVYTSVTYVILLPCRNFFAGIVFLALGKILAEKNTDVNGRKYGAMSLICIAGLIGEYLILDFSRVPITDTDCFIMLPFAAYYICKWILCLNIRCSLSPVLRKLSTLSYCSHMAVFMIVGKLLSILDIPNFGNIIVFTLTLSLTWAIGAVILKLNEYKLFGFLKYSH